MGQTFATPNSENSPSNLGDSRVDVVGTPAYTYSFTVDGVPLLATDKVKPRREGRGGKVAKSIGEGLLLLEDMKH